MPASVTTVTFTFVHADVIQNRHRAEDDEQNPLVSRQAPEAMKFLSRELRRSGRRFDLRRQHAIHDVEDQ
jgi:hypothetical protein